MYDDYDRDDDVFEVDPHALEKDKRQKRIKGRKKDRKSQGQWDDGPKPKKSKGGSYSRHEERQALRDIARNYR